MVTVHEHGDREGHHYYTRYAVSACIVVEVPCGHHVFVYGASWVYTRYMIATCIVVAIPRGHHVFLLTCSFIIMFAELFRGEIYRWG